MTADPPPEVDPNQRREQRLRMLEDDIGRKLAESEANGELRSAKGFGKPMNLQDGYEQTPAELRMGYKLLKDAGVFPPEVELMRDIEALRERIEQGERGELGGRGGASEIDLATARSQLLSLRQQLALRLERLRIGGSL